MDKFNEAKKRTRASTDFETLSDSLGWANHVSKIRKEAEAFRDMVKEAGDVRYTVAQKDLKFSWEE